MDVLVLGGGPAGITAALQARELGAAVTLLEADEIGGTMLNRGPAPVRTLARAARLVRDWSAWGSFGLRGPAPLLDLEAILANAAAVAHFAHDRKDIGGHLRHNGVALAEHLGPVQFVDPNTLRAGDGRTWRAERIIVAVGGHAGRLPVPGGELALDYDDIRRLRALPQSVAVIGGADTGCQIASILGDFGIQVALFEAGPTLIPAADRDVALQLGAAFAARGMELHTSTLVGSLERAGGQVVVHFDGGTGPEERRVDAAFAAIGWPASIDGLGLDAAGVAHEPHAVTVDSFMRTSAAHIFAAGDVDGRSMLVQSARHEGRIAAHNAVAGPTRQPSYRAVPSGSFTDPEYGRVGLTEREAREEHDVVVGVARYDDLLRPVADGRPDGFCKLIADRRDRSILGAHVIGEYSAEVVQVVAAVMASEMPVDRVAELQFAYPTFTEGISMAAQKICRAMGVGRFPAVWSYLGAED